MQERSFIRTLKKVHDFRKLARLNAKIDVHFLSPEILRGSRSVPCRGATNYFRVVISSFYLPSSFRRDREARQTANHNSYARETRAGQDDAGRKKREESLAGEVAGGKREKSRSVPTRVQETRYSPRTSAIISSQNRRCSLIRASSSPPQPSSFCLLSDFLSFSHSLLPFYFTFFLFFIPLLRILHTTK